MSVQFWDRPPPPRLAPGELDEARRQQLQELSRLSLIRARAVATSAERVVWYGRAGIAQYQLAGAQVPLELNLLRDDPTGMVAADIVANANDLERRHHPHLFDCTSWLRQVPAAKRTRLLRAWAAHCAFRVAELRSFVARSLGLPPRFDGTMPRRLRVMGEAIERASDATVQAQKLALDAGDERLIIAAWARLVMLYATFSAEIVAVPLPEAYAAAPETAKLLRAKQRQIALPLADRARQILRKLNRLTIVHRWPGDPWLKAARKAVLRAPRDAMSTDAPSTRPRQVGP